MDKSQSINCHEDDDRSWDLDEDDDNEELYRPVENLSSNSWDSSSVKENHQEGKSEIEKRNCHYQGTEVDRQRGDSEKKIFKRVSSCNSWRSYNLNRTVEAVRRQLFAVSGSSSSNSLDDMEISLPVGSDAVKLWENSPVHGDGQCFEGRKSPKPETLSSCSSEDMIVSLGDNVHVHAVESDDVSNKARDRRFKEENLISYPVEKYQHGMKRNYKKIEEHCLVIEDLEEPIDSKIRMCENQENSISKENIRKENAYSDDAPKIPASEEIQSNDDNESVYNLIRKSEDGRFTKRKWKSNPNFLNLVPSRKTVKKSRSLEKVIVQKNFCPNDIFIQHEGCHIRNSKKGESKNFLTNIKNLGDGSVWYQKIECRTLHTIIDNAKTETAEESKRAKETPEYSPENCHQSASHMHESISRKMSEEDVSLPNIGKKEKNRKKSNLDFRPVTSSTGNTKLIHDNQSIIPGKPATQSWILLDEMGQSQPVTLMEVNFLLNGRSADAVLQENKEHFIPKRTMLRNANSDFHVDHWNPLVEESLQHLLHEDDVCGEHSTSKSIGLERKFGNMLLYIQSGVNLTSSVRFIPVDTEMIQMWKQTKDSASTISSEDDARPEPYENNTEETSEIETLETSDDVRCNAHVLKKVSPAVRKKRCKQNKSDDSEKPLMDNRRIIESLMDDVTQLRIRLETERNRNSQLEQEICLLRNKEKNGAALEKEKTNITEEYWNVDGYHTLDVASSSLLSIEELKKGSIAAAKMNENQGRSTSTEVEEMGSLRDNQRNFKQALDKNISDIADILKCKPRNQERNSKESDESLKWLQLMPENSRMSSMISISTCIAEETSSRNLSQMSNSADSWFKPKKPDAGKNIVKIINELERENEKLVKENLDLKKKLNEISVELDNYITGDPMSSPVEEGRQAESLRSQVCNLKLELENLKNVPKKKEQACKVKEAILREELSEKTVLLETWQASITNMLLEMNECREKMKEIGISIIPKINSEKIGANPNDILFHVRSLIAELSSKIFDYQSENSILKNSLQENIITGAKSSSLGKNCEFLINASKFIYGNISETSADEYCKVLAEKVTLEEETKNLKKENDILLEYQVDHNEKLKNATLALLEEKSKVSTMEKTIKIYEIEKGEVSQVLIGQQEEMALLERELEKERCKLTEFRACYENKRAEVKKLEEKLQEVSEKCKSFDEIFFKKDEIINELKNSCSELESKEFLHSGQIQLLTDQLNKLQNEKSALEEDLQCTKQMAEETKKGMCEYISHLETMVNNGEDKYNETCKSFSMLKKLHDDLEKQNAYDLKMLQKSRDEAEKYKEIANDLEERNKEMEETKKKILEDLNAIMKSEGEKTRTLEKLIGERETFDHEISVLKTRVQNQGRMKDRLIKEQKDLKNELAIVKKESSKLAQKYRNMKSECNERTKLLKHVNEKLKENFFEYNRRLECLENHVSNIVEKAAAFKNCVIEKRTEVNTVVKELQDQLNEVYLEKKRLENEAARFCEEIKRLQKEMDERKAQNIVFPTGMERDSFPLHNSKMTPSDSSDASCSNSKTAADVDNMEIRMKRTAADVTEAQEKIQLLETSKQEEKEAYEAIISDLKSEIARYQIRMKILMKNLPTCGESKRDVSLVKRNPEEFGAKISKLEQKIKELSEELEKKKRQILEMTEVMESNEAEIKKKENECSLLKEKVSQLKRETKTMTSKFSKLQKFLSTVNKNVEVYQKERDEVSEKLAETLQFIMEEKASKQNAQLIYAEKEKFFKEQIKIRLTEEKKNYELLLNSLDEKKKIITKLQDDGKKWKAEVSLLKDQVQNLKEQNHIQNRASVNAEGGDVNAEYGKKSSKTDSELREIRENNLELRKREGSLQARIVQLEDSLRSARLLIKELEGDLSTEKRSKRILKDTITSAKEEIEKFKRGGQIVASVADKIQRHFHASEVQSREMFSDYRARGEERKSSTS